MRAALEGLQQQEGVEGAGDLQFIDPVDELMLDDASNPVDSIAAAHNPELEPISDNNEP